MLCVVTYLSFPHIAILLTWLEMLEDTAYSLQNKVHPSCNIRRALLQGIPVKLQYESDDDLGKLKVNRMMLDFYTRVFL